MHIIRGNALLWLVLSGLGLGCGIPADPPVPQVDLGCLSDGGGYYPQSDPFNCGGCGRRCEDLETNGSNGIWACNMGRCELKGCKEGFAQCGQPDCHYSLKDVRSCGTCGNNCNNVFPNTDFGSATCEPGAPGQPYKCKMGKCRTGFADCDNNPMNGCETEILGQDPLNCGACSSRCLGASAHITPTCDGGICKGTCDPGWADCNGDKRKDGCEVSIQTDPKNCGTCGTFCVEPFGCAMGMCSPVCTIPQMPCNLGGKKYCGDLPNDPYNCGACNKDCTVAHSIPGCNSGACTISACDPGWGDCDGQYANGCEVDITKDLKHCGGCNAACSGNHVLHSSCEQGQWCGGSCEPGWGDCNNDLRSNGCETNLIGNDINNCGACGKVCSAPNTVMACAKGTCVVAKCAPGFADCNGAAADGCEVDLSTMANCGGCGAKCAPPKGTGACMQGVCTLTACDPGFADCDKVNKSGCEVNIAAEIKNCGGCGVVCKQGESCVSGKCSSPGVCAQNNNNGATYYCPGQGNGTCVDLLNDSINCGGCGISCLYPFGGQGGQGRNLCMNGVCTNGCRLTYEDCNGSLQDGCEVDVSGGRDINNCGGCGIICPNIGMHAPALCRGGVCAADTNLCDKGWMDCDGWNGNGCEVDIMTDINNCGRCKGRCPNQPGDTCLGGVCVSNK